MGDASRDCTGKSNASVTPASRWTPDIVLDRLARGVYIAAKADAGRVGPAGYTNSMPEALREFSDKVKSFEEALAEFMEEVEDQTRREFRSVDIAEAFEAIGWPNRFFADEPLLRDALWLKARSEAFGVPIETILRRRRKRADGMLELRKALEPDIVRQYVDDAKDIADPIWQRANASMSRPLTVHDLDRAKARKRARLRRAKRKTPRTIELTPEDLKQALDERNQRIRDGARKRFHAEGKKAKVVERITRVFRKDVMPGKHFWPRKLAVDVVRAAERLAEMLNQLEKSSPLRRQR